MESAAITTRELKALKGKEKAAFRCQHSFSTFAKAT
jgi:hypothetical protein